LHRNFDRALDAGLVSLGVGGAVLPGIAPAAIASAMAAAEAQISRILWAAPISPNG
jgi:hypothetical protein